MGLAKYAEDNAEILSDRMLMFNCYYEQYYYQRTCRTTSTTTTTEKTVSIIRQTPKNTKPTEEYIFCRDCGKKFPFTDRDREFYKANGWTRPKRCKTCRKTHQTLCEMRNY